MPDAEPQWLIFSHSMWKDHPSRVVRFGSEEAATSNTLKVVLRTDPAQISKCTNEVQRIFRLIFTLGVNCRYTICTAPSPVLLFPAFRVFQKVIKMTDAAAKSSKSTKVCVAVTQHEPAWLDLEAGV